MKNTKQGSALLIVLGFLSFMVVSAVAFSIYMRSERLPSSAMRRTVTTRHLVKAALARAIGDIDDALRAEPFPGCMGNNGPTILNAQSGKWNKYGNVRRASWVGRVFMPLAWMDRDGDEAVVENRDDGQIDSTSDNGDLYSIPSIRLDRDSVSTMTLEGLGYVPPPLVNEARLLGRRSWSSAWRYFDYDAGRYAYTALNVSDYFDINRLNANTNRNSGGAGRISLAYLFADTNGKVNQSQAGNFDAFVKNLGDGTVMNRGGEAVQYPFVSMLDYSLALQNTLSGNLANPFFDRLTGGGVKFVDRLTGGGGNQSAFYGHVWDQMSGNRSDALAALMADQTYLRNARPVFLTDSWFGATNTTYSEDVCDLSYPQWQPFWKYEDGYDPLSLCFPPKTPFLKKFLINDSFSLPAVFALYDYLDEDSLPSSLVMPCFERAPMICGFKLVPHGGLQLILKQSLPEDITDGNGTKIGETKTYSMKFKIPQTDVRVSLVYPFKRDRPGESTSYKVQAFARVFFAPAGARARTGGFGTIDWTTWAARENIAQLEADPPANQPPNPTGVTPPNSTILLISEKKTITVPSLIATEKDANCGNGFYVSLPAYDSQTDMPDGWEILKTETLSGKTTVPDEYRSQFAFLDDGGDGNYAQIAPQSSTPLVPQISLVLRVEGDDGTVDLVPANFADDALIDKSIDPSYATRWNSAVTLRTSYLPNNVPLFKFATTFSGGKTFALDPNTLQVLVAGAPETDVYVPADPWPTDAYVCCDPRYNWAPEDWVKRTDNGDLYQIWLDRAHELLGADHAHDADIFMEVSNAGYLQSAYEFMFLPRVCDWSEDYPACGVWGLLNGSGRYPNGNPKGEVEKLANYDLMWRSFLPTALGGEDVFETLGKRAQGLKEWGVQNNATGFRINPYTDNAMIFRAAIENTPLGWWAASTNDTTSSRGSAFKNNDLKKGLEYTFGPNSDFDKDKWAQEKVIAVSEALRTALAGAPSADSGLPAADAWKTAFDTMWANSFDADDENKLFGIDMGSATLHGVDRKFLYGFWRDCFACSQQLFLIFVRAESTALGGSGEGRTPGQLGGRAVALVWRDPKEPPSSNDNNLELPYAMTEGEQTKEKTRTPHKTRILFYHQFD